jgi:hypothetical protein
MEAMILQKPGDDHYERTSKFFFTQVRVLFHAAPASVQLPRRLDDGCPSGSIHLKSEHREGCFMGFLAFGWHAGQLSAQATPA